MTTSIKHFSSSLFSDARAVKSLVPVVATAITAVVLSAVLWMAPAHHSYPADAPIAYATVHKIHYLSNFWLYLGGVLICGAAGLLASYLSPGGFPAFLRRGTDGRGALPRSSQTRGAKALLMAGAVLLLAVVGFTSQFFYSISGSLLRIRDPFTALLADTFHEGELLARCLLYGWDPLESTCRHASLSIL